MKKHSMKNKIAGLLLMATIVFASCKKDSVQSPPPPDKKYQLITTGHLIDLSTNNYLPCYWVGGEFHAVDKGGHMQAFTYGFDKVGNDIYIAGNYSPDGQSLLPCYWKNGELIELPVDGLVIEDRCSVRDVRWFNDALYFLGDVDLAPYIWKIKNGVVAITKVKGNVNQPYGLISGANMEIYQNKIYFAGNEAFEKGNGAVAYQSGYWTIDMNDQQKFHILEDQMGYAISGGIAVSAKGIYINGETASSPGRHDEKAVMWTSTGRMPQIDLLNRNRQRVGEVVADNGGNIYTIINDIQDYQPVFWKLLPGGSHEVIKPAVPAQAKGFCNNLAMHRNKLAYAWSYAVNNKYYAYVGMDDKQTPLEMNHDHDVRLTRTRIFEE
jgi:hypothetical protein